MDALVRRRRPLLIAALLGAAACAGSAGKGPPVGVSDKPPVGAPRAASPDAGFADGAAALPPGYRTTFKKVNASRFVSRGHAFDRFEVDVYANDLAATALGSRSREVPVGAIAVAEHRERRGDQGAGPIMLMEKKAPGFSPEHGDWRWVVVGAAGNLVRDGVIEECAGCHDDAPMDGLFPVVE